ncbi:bcl-2-associated athanogene-like protein [Trifolium pratense]|uniref:Bcl-2-associated athanogene-like protein n=1 Tax=Trifolium pratense TaxID=57577 RepID=A0A2K3KPR4_TRIPR|nr:bcl-2-associated athanogene-like protein [Trifolium pratense]
MDSLVNEEKDVVGGEAKFVKEEENCLMEEKEDEDVEKMEVEEESVGTSLVEEEEGIEVDSMVVKEEEGRIGIECEEENCYKEGDDGNRKMLKRMMEDNEKMMDMMAQLFERNEKQTKLLTSLTQRVEQLERSFTCDKLRKKKRRNVDVKHRYYNGCI